MSPESKQVAVDAIWRNNPALVQLLGLCPLLGVSNNVVNAMGLGLATVVVLSLSSLSVSLLRRYISNSIRLPAFMMIIATFTTCIELLMQAFTYELYVLLGIFIPIIVTNCAILGRAEGFARRHGVWLATWDGATNALGFALALIALGALRELLGSGALFADMHLLFGAQAAGWEMVLFRDYPPVLVAILPPGAFICTGLLIAAHTYSNDHLEQRKKRNQYKIAAGSKRVRVTDNAGLI
jgi:electron transport complex protein RnfE